MAKSFNQKQKLLYILDILKEKSDESHVLNVNYMIKLLEKNGIKAERKSIYDDIDTLVDYGYNIVLKKGRNGGYYLKSKKFDSSELNLLSYAVQSCEFITDRKCHSLISKLSGLTNTYERKKLQSNDIVKNRIKSNNESIFLNVDRIHEAISQNEKIYFSYFEWTVGKDGKLRRNGRVCKTSPWSLFWDDHNCYLLGFDSGTGTIVRYRIDKMLNIKCSEDYREGDDSFNNFNADFFEEKYCNVKLECKNEFADVIIDKFGKDIDIYKSGEESFCFNINVKLDHSFFGWITGLGSGVLILEPNSVVNEYKYYIKDILVKYN